MSPSRGSWNVAVVGATGLVGRKILQVLAERRFPVKTLRPLATARSAGSSLGAPWGDVRVEELGTESFGGIDIAIFSAGAAVSREYASVAVGAGAVVIDNSSAFRMEPGVPLVVPEVNPGMIGSGGGIIANPNCSTIQLVVVLKPLHDRWGIRRVVVSTYQSVTGAGQRALDQLRAELSGTAPAERKFPHPIAYNALPQVDVFAGEGHTREELKMVNETVKILGDPAVKVSATCVRVPTTGGHSEAVNVEFEKPFRLEEIREVLGGTPGVVLQDDVGRNIYPMPIWSEEKDDVFVGRIRRDGTVPSGLNLWIVSDNLRKGAATNAVQIAEIWAKNRSISHPHTTERS